MRDKANGTYNGDTTCCPVNAYRDCNVCHIDNPIVDCDDFCGFYENWDEWIALGQLIKF